MVMRSSVILGLCGVLLVTSLAGCGGRQLRDDGLRFDGERFRINAKKVSKEDRSLFTVTASPVSRTLAGAREAARYGGTQYCIENYGTSNIKWDVAPDVEDITPFIDRDSLTLTGQCKP